ncbi:hypothetical protein M8C21_030799, partial [Ambrosia artemisiifolia]
MGSASGDGGSQAAPTPQKKRQPLPIANENHILLDEGTCANFCNELLIMKSLDQW